MSSTSMIKNPTWWENLEEDDLSQPDENEDNILMNSYQGVIEGFNVPKHGWKISLNHQFKHQPTFWTLPPLTQIPAVLGLSWRYLKYHHKLRNQNKRPCMDFFNQTKLQTIYGVPLGGIGCGTVNRGWKGDFCRWQLKPGSYSFGCPSADQFILCIRKKGRTILQQVLNPSDPPSNKSLNTWNWKLDGSSAYYTGLYPCAWTTYNFKDQKLVVTCKQISPIFPHDYKDTSLPAGIFTWHLFNDGDEELEVTICMSMENGNGSSVDSSRICGLVNQPFNDVQDCCGVEMRNSSQYPRMPYSLCVATSKKQGVVTSSLVNFDPSSNGSELWKPLLDEGHFPPISSTSELKTTSKGERTACAVAASCVLAPKSSSPTSLDFALSWDMPKIHFGDGAKMYRKRYTRWYGCDGNQGPIIAQYALQNYSKWEQKIEEWQKPIIENPKLPDWYKSAIFNELYYISDGGTVWLEHEPAVEPVDGNYANIPENTKHIADEILKMKIAEEFGHFAYLEGHEYKMYNTYDVHFYASIALASLWPKLELSLQIDFAIGILQSEPLPRQYLMDGVYAPAKTPNVVPHDLGCPDDEPWLNINTYFVHDTANWRDLNPKFVLQFYRDYHLTQDTCFLETIYPVCKIVMEKSDEHDIDDDGLIENSGGADQTFDGWFVTGASAYCGGLWLAALRSMIAAAKILKLEKDVEKYSDQLKRATSSYQAKLWNGRYFNYDCSLKQAHRTSVMADQCAGQWYLSTSGITDVLPAEQIKSALKTIYEFNVQKYDGGRHGAVNGMKPNGCVDCSSVQSNEVWTGVTYSLSATMIFHGMFKEGFHTASGIYRSSWQRYGMAYQTPEAFRKNKTFRSLGYMRPLSIWSIQYAIENYQSSLVVKSEENGDSGSG